MEVHLPLTIVGGKGIMPHLDRGGTGISHASRGHYALPTDTIDIYPGRVWLRETSLCR